ncbi:MULTISPECIES: DUF4282 domain-containing protein [Arthrobacter]|uniref:DUF4282 domain-containing protein n=1 Tax=Arthrobacter sunyaminii TaxID=2816859 RepID=A0A975XL30_9MICC|nr:MULTISPECIES: DUF4282 domain-containing protein [Arthrobacter]MBO0909899.1 DUF4282 domain-containing protein [Arthrobacter sunyaminii]QWQ36684.1 DUF4282 domain-containing protein [Arthrobacter sunyaminii]
MINFFDPSFKKFSAPILIKLYYGLSVGLLALFWLVLLIRAFDDGFLSGFLVLILGPVVAFFLLIATRISCEWILATIQVSQNTAKLVDLMGGTSAPLAGAAAPGGTSGRRGAGQTPSRQPAPMPPEQ